MGYKSAERPRHMIFYIDFLIKERPWRIRKDLITLIGKYAKFY